jgi:hypothetical protein
VNVVGLRTYVVVCIARRVSYVGMRTILFGEAWVIETRSKIVIENTSITLNMML